MRMVGVVALLSFVACSDNKEPGETVIADMVLLPGGAFLGRDKRCFDGTFVEKHPGEEPPLRARMTIAAFEIDRRVVSCTEYEHCIASGRCTEDGYVCRRAIAVAPRPSAVRYCTWRHARLPTYVEWQRAVRGVDGMLYRDNNPANTYTPDADQFGVIGRPHISGDGVEYSMSSVIPELTRDDDCTIAGRASGADTSTIDPLVVALDGPELTRVRQLDESGRFRCVVER